MLRQDVALSFPEASRMTQTAQEQLRDTESLPLSSISSLLSLLAQGAYVDSKTKFIDLLAFALQRVAQMTLFELNGSLEIGEGSVSGKQCLELLVNRFLDLQWNDKALFSIVLLSKEIQMVDQKQFLRIMVRLSDKFSLLDSDETPRFCYNWLIACSKFFRRKQKSEAGVAFCMKVFLCRLGGFDLEPAVSENVLQFIESLISHDSSICDAVIQLVKSKEVLLTEITMLFLLQMYRSLKYRAKIHDVLTKFLQETDRIEKYSSISTLHEKAVGVTFSIGEVLESFATYCSEYFSYLVEHLVKLLFSLYVQKRCSGKMRRKIRNSISVIFSKRPEAREYIIQHINHRIFFEEGAQDSVSLLFFLWVNHRKTVIPFSRLFRPFVDNVASLPEDRQDCGLQWLDIVLKLSSKNKDLQQDIAVLLRKLLFHPNPIFRKTSILGFFSIIRHGIQEFEQMNDSQSSYDPSPDSGQFELFMEVMGFLRRALMQQREVRRDLYNGLVQLFQEISDASFRDSIASFVLDHIRHFVDTSGSTKIPFILDWNQEASADAYLDELFIACQRICLAQKSINESTPHIKELHKMMLECLARLGECHLDDFAILTKGIDESDVGEDEKSSDSLKCREIQRAAVAIVTSFVEFVFQMSDKDFSQYSQNLGRLFTLQQGLLETYEAYKRRKSKKQKVAFKDSSGLQRVFMSLEPEKSTVVRLKDSGLLNSIFIDPMKCLQFKLFVVKSLSSSLDALKIHHHEDRYRFALGLTIHVLTSEIAERVSMNDLSTQVVSVGSQIILDSISKADDETQILLISKALTQDKEEDSFNSAFRNLVQFIDRLVSLDREKLASSVIRCLIIFLEKTVACTQLKIDAEVIVPWINELLKTCDSKCSVFIRSMLELAQTAFSCFRHEFRRKLDVGLLKSCTLNCLRLLGDREGHSFDFKGLHFGFVHDESCHEIISWITHTSVLLLANIQNLISEIKSRGLRSIEELCRELLPHSPVFRTCDFGKSSKRESTSPILESLNVICDCTSNLLRCQVEISFADSFMKLCIEFLKSIQALVSMVSLPFRLSADMA